MKSIIHLPWFLIWTMPLDNQLVDESICLEAIPVNTQKWNNKMRGSSFCVPPGNVLHICQYQQWGVIRLLEDPSPAHHLLAHRTDPRSCWCSWIKLPMYRLSTLDYIGNVQSGSSDQGMCVNCPREIERNQKSAYENGTLGILISWKLVRGRVCHLTSLSTKWEGRQKHDPLHQSILDTKWSCVQH